MLKSYSLPTTVIVQVLDDNDNLPYEPFLSNHYELTIEQINRQPTIIYEFKPIDLDYGLNGKVSIDCLNCTLLKYFQLNKSYLTNRTILITKENQTIPDGIYTLAFLLRDHGIYISRERIYTLTFNFTHRFQNEDNYQEEDENLFQTTSSIPFFDKQKLFWKNLFYEKFHWRFLIILILSWLILVLIALWTCYRYGELNKKKQQQKEQHEQFEIHVRQHEIISSPIPILPKSSLLPINSQTLYDKETFTQDDDEIEDTSYDADHIITDANFVLTSGCATNESNGRYVSLNKYIFLNQLLNTGYRKKKTFDFFSI